MRIQLVVSESEYNNILEIKNQSNAHTIKEVFNNALTLFQWALQQRREGYSIYAVHEKKHLQKELQMYALNQVAQSATLTEATDEPQKAVASSAG